MKRYSFATLLLIAGCMALVSCHPAEQSPSAINIESASKEVMDETPILLPEFSDHLDIYKPVVLTADLSHLSGNQQRMLSILIDASMIMDDLFWKQSFGKGYEQFLKQIENDKVRQFAEINYGPWDRIRGNKPFLTGYSDKAPGAQFYPADMTRQEFDSADFEDKEGLYSAVVRGEDSRLKAVPYSVFFRDELTKAANLLRDAARLAEDKEFANYLNLRAEALLNDDYYPSDMAWMDMKNNPIDLVYGPIETYEDQLYGYRAAFQSILLVKDMAWSERLARFASLLPQLQNGLPVAKEYKQEMPGTDSDLNAYDVIFYGGQPNANGKPIAINLPNNENVQLQKGSRRLQLKNAMRAKFDQVLLPIVDQLVAPDQRKHITFDAFFAGTMFHEVAHGLGIKNTINGKGTVRHALKENFLALEETKADILGLYMMRELFEEGELNEGSLEDFYTTYLAGIFRSVRFGASSAQGQANMVIFNFFNERGAFIRDAQGFYRVDFDIFNSAMNEMSALTLTMQGNGDYEGVAKLVADKGVINDQLAADLAKIEQAGIPVDIVFRQGKQVLEL